MRKWIFLLLLSCLSKPLSAQNNVELFGYFESQLMGAQIKNSFIQLQSNKLRVDLKTDLSDNVSFGANFNYITYHGKTHWNILEYLPDRVTSEVPPELVDYYVLPFDDRIFLDNAYVRLSFKYGDVIMGKQQISLGTGYAWNPTDLFNTKDLLDPTYEQPGHNALQLDVPLGSMYSVTTLTTPSLVLKKHGHFTTTLSLIRLARISCHFQRNAKWSEPLLLANCWGWVSGLNMLIIKWNILKISMNWLWVVITHSISRHTLC
jgi:hypothetical protein